MAGTVVAWVFLVFFVIVIWRLGRGGPGRIQRASTMACAVCGESLVGVHSCHLEGVAVRDKAARKSYGLGYYWKPVVRDHYGAVAQLQPVKSREVALRLAASEMRAIQAGQRGDVSHAIGPRPGAETMAHRVAPQGLRWKSLLESTGYRCHYCNQVFRAGDLQREHRVPLSRGGVNSAANIVPSCGPCNREKGTMTDVEYFDFLAKVRARGAAQHPRRLPPSRAVTPRIADAVPPAYWIFDRPGRDCARLHHSNCRYCNGGAGQGRSRSSSGSWVGPFDTYEAAQGAWPMRFRGDARDCGVCHPGRPSS